MYLSEADHMIHTGIPVGHLPKSWDLKNKRLRAGRPLYLSCDSVFSSTPSGCECDSNQVNNKKKLPNFDSNNYNQLKNSNSIKILEFQFIYEYV